MSAPRGKEIFELAEAGADPSEIFPYLSEEKAQAAVDNLRRRIKLSGGVSGALNECEQVLTRSSTFRKTQNLP